MVSLTGQLQAQVDSARRDVETAKEFLVQAQDALNTWESALSLAIKQAPERRTPLPISHTYSPRQPNMIRSGFSLEDAKNKETLVLAALNSAGSPMSVVDLKQALGEAISRSMAYKIIGDLKHEGKIARLPDGRYEVVQQEIKEVEATEVAS